MAVEQYGVSSTAVTRRMSVSQEDPIAIFIKKHAIACGGNWSAMLMSAIENGLPDVYQQMEDRSYSFVELYEILESHVL